MIIDPNEDMRCEHCGKRVGDAVFYDWLFLSEELKDRELRFRCMHCGKINTLISRTMYDRMLVTE